jgi:molecular chaperone DnaK
VRRLDAGTGFSMRAGPGGGVVIEVRGQALAPSQVVGFILEHFRTLAERRFDADIYRVVLTVPAGASRAYCDDLSRAAGFARLEVARFVPEPVAGMMALGKAMAPAERVLAVCDFGGGTFDTTLVRQEGLKFKTLAMRGDPLLGGDDFDELMAEAVAGHVFELWRYDMHKDLVRWTNLVRVCEMVKRSLSFDPSATLAMRDAYTVRGRQHDLRLEMERRVMEPRWEPLLEQAREILGQLTGAAPASKPDEVLMIGGTSLIPAVQRAVGDHFRCKLNVSEVADLAVTIGAAMEASNQ